MLANIPFSGDPLDRAGNERRNPEWVERMLASPDTRYLPYWKLNPLSTIEDEPKLAQAMSKGESVGSCIQIIEDSIDPSDI